MDQTVVQAGALTNSIEACRAVQLPGWNTEEEQNENSFEWRCRLADVLV